jgi:hypothetical protein
MYLRTSASAGGGCAGGAVRTAGAGDAVGVALGDGLAVRTAVAVVVVVVVAVAVAVAAAVAVCVTGGFRVAVGLGVAEGEVDGAGVFVGAAVTCATRAIGVGVCMITSGVWLGDGVGACRAANAESSAPIPRPAMITPANSGTIGKPPRPSSSFEERRRRGEPDPELMFRQRSTREGLALDGRAHAKAKR